MRNVDSALCPFYKRTQIEYRMMEMTNYVGQYMLGGDEYEVFDGSFFFWQRSADQLGVDLFLFVDATRNAKKERFKLLTYYQQTGAIHYSPAALVQLIKPAIIKRAKTFFPFGQAQTDTFLVGQYDYYDQYITKDSRFFWQDTTLYATTCFYNGNIPAAKVKLQTGFEWNSKLVFSDTYELSKFTKYPYLIEEEVKSNLPNKKRRIL